MSIRRTRAQVERENAQLWESNTRLKKELWGMAFERNVLVYLLTLALATEAAERRAA